MLTAETLPALGEMDLPVTVEVDLDLVDRASLCLPKHQFTWLLAAQNVGELRRESNALGEVFGHPSKELEAAEIRQLRHLRLSGSRSPSAPCTTASAPVFRRASQPSTPCTSPRSHCGVVMESG